MATLTIFTPTYNREHTIWRTYESLKRQSCKDFRWLIIDDGSSDGTRELVKSWGQKSKFMEQKFDWMGREIKIKSLENKAEDHFVIDVDELQIEYIYKTNGGLYTGYNVAFQTIKTELCVCIDSDDYMPDDAVDNIVNIWNSLSSEEKAKVGGIAGLDYDVTDSEAIGGVFPVDNQFAWIQNLHHSADSKYVFRTEEIKRYSPQIGFKGENDFNPHYMQMQLFDRSPMWVVNKNFCWVEYQFGGDSMSQAIFKQYMRSPKSCARYRLMELSMTRGVSLTRKFSLCAHYISACIFSHDVRWFKNSNNKGLVLLAVPLGICFNLFIRYKAKR